MSEGQQAAGGEEFLAKMLNDVLRLMPTAGAGVGWPLAYQLAASSAAGDSPDPNPDPRERIALEELGRIAAMHVSDVTGMQLSPSGRAPLLVPASRGEWARHLLDSWRPVLDRLGHGKTADSATAGASGSGDLGALLSRWAAAATPMMLAMQVGSAVGQLAGRALGYYEVPLAPAIGDEIFTVSVNLKTLASDWSLPEEDLSLWLSAHEMALHAVLSRPHVARRLAELVIAHAETVGPDADAIQQLLSRSDATDPDSLMELFGDPSALTPPAGSKEVERLRGELDALTAVISGYAEHVTATVAERLVGGHAPIGEAMRRRRVGRGEGEKMAEQLFGLSLDQAQIDRGGRFIDGVIERSGESELARLFTNEALLPTPSEVDAPGLWLARLGLDD